MPARGIPRRREELIVFLFLTIVLAPVLAVGIVGGYGFAIWCRRLSFSSSWVARYSASSRAV